MNHLTGPARRVAMAIATMIVLMAIALTLYVAVDRLLVRAMPWAPLTLTRIQP